MRIAIVTEALNTRSGARAPINLAIALSKLNNEVTILALSKNSMPQLRKDLENQGIEIILFNHPKIISSLELIKTLLALKVEVISFHATLTFLIASKLTNIPIVKTYYGTQLDAYLENVFGRNLNIGHKIANYTLNSVVTFVDKLQFFLSDKTLGISIYCAKQAKILFGKKIDYVYLGSNLVSNTNKDKNTNKFILSVSRFTPYKGFHKLIEACRDLPLVIAGSPEKKEYLKYLQSVKSKNHQLKINVDDKELASLYKNCIFLASFDRWPFFGMPILEAATFGKGAIALNHGAMSELIVNNKTGYIVKNEQEFTRLANKLYKNTELAQKLGARAKAYAKNFTWEKTALSYEKIFQNLKHDSISPPVLVLTIVIGLFLRIMFAGQHDFWFDEAFSYFIAKNDLGQIIRASLGDNTPPAYYIVLHIWLNIAGNTPQAIRFLSLIFGALTIPLTYYLAKKLFNPKVGLISSQIVALSPLFIYFSQEARMYSMLMFLTLSSVYFFSVFKSSQNLKPLILFALCQTCAIYTQYIAALLLIPLNLLILNSRNRELIKYFLTAQIAILALVSPLLFGYLKFTHPAIYSTKLELAIPATFASFVSASTGAVTLRNYLEDPLITVIVAITLAIFSFLFLKEATTKDKDNQTVLTLFLTPILILTVIGLFFPIFSVRSTIIIAPFFYFLVAKSLGKSKVALTYLVFSLFVIINIVLLTKQELKGPPLSKFERMTSENITIAHTSILTYYPFRFYSPSKNNVLIGTSPLSTTTKTIIGSEYSPPSSLPNNLYLVEIESGQDPKEIERINTALVSAYLEKTTASQQGLTLKLLEK